MLVFFALWLVSIEVDPTSNLSCRLLLGRLFDSYMVRCGNKPETGRSYRLLAYFLADRDFVVIFFVAWCVSIKVESFLNMICGLIRSGTQ